MAQAYPRQQITLNQQVATRLLYTDTPAPATEVASEHRTRPAAHAAPEAAT